MRIEKLTDNRIKVTLTSADLMSLNINIKQLTPDSKELHSFLFHVMETIHEETDFNPYSGQVVVEATPAHDGISIIVSKLCAEREVRKQPRKITSVRPKQKNSHTELKAYYFDDFEALCEALVRLRSSALLCGKLYRTGNDYCLIMTRLERSDYILSEFSSDKSSYSMQAEHIMEHWELVAAGEKLLSMAQGIIALRQD